MKIQPVETSPAFFKPVSVTFTFESQAELDAMTTLMASGTIDSKLQEVLAVKDGYIFSHEIADELVLLGGQSFRSELEEIL